MVKSVGGINPEILRNISTQRNHFTDWSISFQEGQIHIQLRIWRDQTGNCLILTCSGIDDGVEVKEGFSSFPALSTLDPDLIRQLNKTKGLNFKQAHKAAKEAQGIMHRAESFKKGWNSRGNSNRHLMLQYILFFFEGRVFSLRFYMDHVAKGMKNLR